MRRTAVGLAVCAGLLTAACSQGGNQVTVQVESPSAGVTPSSGESPTVDSSTTATPEPVGPPQVLDVVATGLETPWGLDFLPDGDAIVTERDTARVLRIDGETFEITELGTVGSAQPQGEGGLLGVAVSPTFKRDGRLYFYYSAESDNRIGVSRLITRTKKKQTTETLTPPRPILTGIPLGSIHDGGRLIFGPDGYLYASTGDAGESENAQNRKSLGGKILRLTASGQAAPGNPLDTPPWSFGHRNIQGLAFTDDEQLWASEFGMNAFDELNQIAGGGNYGWPEVEGTGGAAAGFIDPQAVWSTDVASPSGLAYADGALWMAALRGNRLWKVPLDRGGDAKDPEAYFIGEYGRLRTVVAAPDGTLWVTTSNRDGRGAPGPDDDQILRISP